jgi:endonuclease-3
MNPTKIQTIFKRLHKVHADLYFKTELNYRTSFQLMVAVILSAQATDASVNKVTSMLFRIAGTPQKMLALGEEGLKNYIKSIGLFNSKAKNIMAATHLIVSQHKGRIPGDRKSLEALPGVGRKTANIILNILFEQPTIAVDTHVFRVANRTKLAKGKTPSAVERGLLRITPKAFLKEAHHWLVLHGRYVCKARKPLCRECILRDVCEYDNKTN